MTDADLRQPASPPLRIHHLLLFMTCIAVVACWRQALTDKLAEIPRSYAPYKSPADVFRISLTQTIGYGGMLAVTIASVAWKLRHRAAAWEPGQWLALLGAVEFVREVALTLDRFVPWFGPPDDGRSFTLPVRREFAYYLACAAVVAFVAVRRNHGWAWRAAFGALALQLLIYALSNGVFVAARWFHWSETAFNRIFGISIDVARCSHRAALVAICVAAVVQLVRKPRGSWAHWTGVVLWLGFGWIFEIARYLSAP